MLNASPQRGRKAALESGDGVRTLPLSFLSFVAKDGWHQRWWQAAFLLLSFLQFEYSRPTAGRAFILLK